jgi:hypothetical protein
MWSAVTLAVAYAALLGAWGYWVAARHLAGLPVWPAVISLPLFWFAIPILVTALSFLLAQVFRAKRPARFALGLRSWARVVWREFVAIAGNTPRMIFYRWLVPDPKPAAASRPVLLVHGVLCNGGVWQWVCRRLAERHIAPVYALSYGPPLASIDDFADQVACKIDEILTATGATGVVVVAHSMGGLVARAYLRRYGGAKVRKLITVGTPHEGSIHARLVPGISLSQIRPANPWLDALGPPAGADMPPIVSVWSWHDTMVAPQTSSRITYGENVELGGVGHNALLTDPEVARRIAEEIRQA